MVAAIERGYPQTAKISEASYRYQVEVDKKEKDNRRRKRLRDEKKSH